MRDSKQDVHGQLPFLEVFIILGIVAMLGAAVITWYSTDKAEQSQRAQQEATLQALRNAAAR